MKKNDIVTLTVTDLNNLGYGVGRLGDGCVVFVAGGVTGDTVEARIIKVAPSYLVARLERIITPSPYRLAEPICGAPQSCGGCVYRNVTRECELEMKRAYVESLFVKAGLPSVNVLPVATAGERIGYRNKAQYPVRMTKAGIKAGFFASKTHNVVSSDRCMLEPEIFASLVDFVCDFADRHGISAYDETSGKGILRHIYLRMGKISGQIMLCLVINSETFPCADLLVAEVRERFADVVSIMLNINRKNTNVVTGDRYVTLYGESYIEDELCGIRFRISPDSFWQVNHDGAELLYRTARELTELDGEQSLLDLYCGTGTIGLSMARYARRVTGVEIVPAAVECARLNASVNGIENAEFYCADASATESIIPPGQSYNAAILDPPRKGTTRELIEYISRAGINKVIYISCGPDTLARDCTIFKELGYEIGDVHPVDMFPLTGHVECVVLLSRKSKVHRMKLHPAPFEMIKSGEKTVELRLYDEKRREIKPGDGIVFSNVGTGEEISTTVVGLHRFDNFAELYRSLPLTRCGYDNENVKLADPSDMEEYYSADEQAKYGVVGIELRLDEA